MEQDTLVFLALLAAPNAVAVFNSLLGSPVLTTFPFCFCDGYWISSSVKTATQQFDFLFGKEDKAPGRQNWQVGSAG